MSNHRERQFIWFLAVLAVFLIAGSVLFQSFFAEYLPFLSDVFGQAGTFAGLLFVVLSSLSVLLGPFSSIFLVPLAITVWGDIATLWLLLLGWLIGGVFSYIVGRYAGYALVIKLAARHKVDRWIREISAHATLPLAFLFRLALPAETGYVFGLARYHFGKYLLIIFFAELPFALVAVYSGKAFVRAEPVILGVWLFAGIAVVALSFVFLRKTYQK